MRIGINALYLLPGKVGGTETYARNLAAWLTRIDPDNEYFIFINKECTGIFESEAPRIRVITCPIHASRRPVRILWEQMVLPFQVKRHGIDVLLSAGLTAPFFCPAVSVLVLHDLQHINQPGNFPQPYLFFLKSIIYCSAKSADGIVTMSEQVKRDIERFYHVAGDRIEVTYLAADHDLFKPAPSGNVAGIRQKHGLPERYILYAAASLPHKNHARLLSAFTIVKKEIPGLKLLLIGARDKGAQQLMEKIADAGLQEDVILLGWVPIEDVTLIYQTSECFVFPTLHEGFGLPVIEAMATGVPVVCSGIEPLFEVAGDAAFFVDPNDERDIARGIVSVLSNDLLKSKLIEKGFRRARKFTWEKTAQKTLLFLETVAARKKR